VSSSKNGTIISLTTRRMTVFIRSPLIYYVRYFATVKPPRVYFLRVLGPVSLIRCRGFISPVSMPLFQTNQPSNSLVALAVSQRVRKLLERTANQLGLLPKVGRQEAISVRDGRECGLEGVLESLGRTRR
jgi:hypothetical protein